MLDKIEKGLEFWIFLILIFLAGRATGFILPGNNIYLLGEGGELYDSWFEIMF